MHTKPAADAAGRSTRVGGILDHVTPASVVKWIVILAVLYFSGTEAETVGFPAPHLFAALIVGLILSLRGRSSRSPGASGRPRPRG